MMPCHSGLSLPGFGIQALEGLGIHRVLHARVDLVARGPDIADPHVLAVFALAQRLGHQVAQHGAGDGVSHDQRRRGEEVGAQIGMDAGLEVAVARQHRRAHQIVLDDGLLDRFGQGPGVADAGGAAVAGEEETELLQVGQQAGVGEIFGHHARSGRERGLDVRLDREAALDRFFREQARRRAARSGWRCWCRR